MKLFSTLCLELTSDCNRRCEFCPVAYFTRTKEYMPKKWVRSACRELESLKYRGRVEFYIYNEPLRDKEHLLWAIDLFREVIPATTLMISTNGDF
ncbi:MAG: hypothetical protein QQN63_10520, partial [Nitrosopumilus sp.]